MQLNPDREARLKPAPKNGLWHRSHQLKLVANGESAEAD